MKKCMFPRRLFVRSADCKEGSLSGMREIYTKEIAIYAEKKLFQCTRNPRHSQFIVRTVGGLINGIRPGMDGILIQAGLFWSNFLRFRSWSPYLNT